MANGHSLCYGVSPRQPGDPQSELFHLGTLVQKLLAARAEFEMMSSTLLKRGEVACLHADVRIHFFIDSSSHTGFHMKLHSIMSDENISTQRRPALIPKDADLNADDILAIKRRVGQVIPSFPSSLKLHKLEAETNQKSPDSGPRGTKRKASTSDDITYQSILSSKQDGCPQDGSKT
jgi:hypothetical protein